jgi:uncharacterized protein YjbJ (UPF0337 family)
VNDRNEYDRESLSSCCFPEKVFAANATENRDHRPGEIRYICSIWGFVPVKLNRPQESTADKLKGATNEAIGKAKQGVGEAVGSDKLQGEGAIQEVKGKGQKAVGDAKEATKDAVNKAAAAANKNL